MSGSKIAKNTAMSRHAPLFRMAAAVLGLASMPCAAQTSPIAVTGTLTNEGVICRALRADDGTLYTFRRSGLIDGFQPGDRIRIEGTISEISICQQGVTIDVTKAERTK